MEERSIENGEIDMHNSNENVTMEEYFQNEGIQDSFFDRMGKTN